MNVKVKWHSVHKATRVPSWFSCIGDEVEAVKVKQY